MAFVEFFVVSVGLVFICRNGDLPPGQGRGGWKCRDVAGARVSSPRPFVFWPIPLSFFLTVSRVYPSISLAGCQCPDLC